ncbi:hypothetical protein [Antrihabitans sp. YC2-6]|uniref:hypothetical protein n=1 Tax=Antrihabitans sp. YC2-6 TaxID=2799498 RepID=UPI0018F72CD9|nr:hypothetical protein [Antrihabitans sp. YC2-6]MBJ8343865.1 hypothetical protein [Antrihabitans sp. YC2-6]
MIKTSIRRLVFVPIAATAALATMVGVAGVASAGTLPSGSPTTAMTITNDTNQTMWLASSNNPYGSWIAAPHQSLAPHETEIVTAVSNGSTPVFPINISYAYGSLGSVANFVSTNDYSGATTDGSGVTGNNVQNYDVQTSIDSGPPAVNASYILAPMMM